MRFVPIREQSAPNAIKYILRCFWFLYVLRISLPEYKLCYVFFLSKQLVWIARNGAIICPLAAKIVNSDIRTNRLLEPKRTGSDLALLHCATNFFCCLLFLLWFFYCLCGKWRKNSKDGAVYRCGDKNRFFHFLKFQIRITFWNMMVATFPFYTYLFYSSDVKTKKSPQP